MVVFKKLSEKKAIKNVGKVIQMVNLMTDNKLIDEKIIIETLYNFLNAILYNNIHNENFEFTATMTSSNSADTVKIIEYSDITFKKIFNYSAEKLSKLGLEKVLEITTSFFKIKGISIKQYINLLDSENNMFQNSINTAIENCSLGIIDDFISTRFNFISKLIKNYDKTIKDNSYFIQDKSILYRLFKLYLSYKITASLYQMKILQIYTFVKENYFESKDDTIRKIYLENFIDINNKYLVEDLTVNEEYLEDCKYFFKDFEFDNLKSKLSEKDTAKGMSSFSFGQGDLNKKIVDENNLRTYIHFTIPFKTKSNVKGNILLDDGIVLYYRQLKNKFEDPIYRCYKEMNIMGKGLNYFSDAFVNDDLTSTTIDLLFPYFYNPDLVINDGGYIQKDFKLQKAKIGRDYYPHKEFIIELLINNLEKINKKIELKLEEISVDLFSNYIVEFLIGNSLQYRKLYSLTNPNSLEKSSNKFLEQLKNLKLSDPYLTIKEMVENLDFDSDYKFKKSICKIMDFSVKDMIEKNGGYRYFWHKEEDILKPNTEPQMQPYIYILLNFICSYLGIQVSKEPEIANGKLDFLLTYNNSSKLIKTCVEVKNAHGNIKHGIHKQLPEYMKTEKTKNGIYLVLWYKGKDFSKPNEYSNKEELKTLLVNEIPNGLNIEVIIIDCHKPVVPSKLK